MTLGRSIVAALVGVLVCSAPMVAQETTGTITGRVVDGATLQPIATANVIIEGTQRGVVTRADGSFLLPGVPAGTHRVRASLIGFGAETREVTVAAGATATVQFNLQPQAVVLDELVATGYGTQRREAITGSVAVINADAANVGVVTAPTEMIQGRVAGVNITANNGEPGSGVQIRIRGGTSISASNEPLYVIDGVPIDNRSTEPGGVTFEGINSTPLARNPLSLLNPADIESITILKDASATAIYGSRAANGVVLIQTKRGGRGQVAIEYDGYVATSAPARRLGFLSGSEYAAWMQAQGAGGATLGSENTNWEEELTRRATTHNHNLSFSGGSENTTYRASLNYMNQEGVVISSGFERIQGRLNADHRTWGERLRLGLNLTSSHVVNDYLPYENTGGFIGGVFTNMAIYNPTRPVRIVDPQTGETRFYEVGTSRQDVRNPVALAEQIDDVGNTTRTLGNASVALDLIPGVTGQVNLGIDRSEAQRSIYFPMVSAVGAEWNGRALQRFQNNNALTLQTFVTAQHRFAASNLDFVGGYEYADYTSSGFGAESRDFLTDFFGFNRLEGGGTFEVAPYSYREDYRLVSFFSRANYSLADRYYLTGVLRYDGSSRFGEGHKWALFPAISASWRISEEPFMRDGFFSDLRLRAGYGLQGNPAVAPYGTLYKLTSGGHYAFGDERTSGMVPAGVANPDLKWEQTAQFNVALDYGLLSNRVSGTAEYYVKNTTDLLLEVPVVQPAVAATRLENIGKVRNRGVELSLDAIALERPALRWRAGLVFTAERNEVVDLGGREFIETGEISGEGQSGFNAQRIMPGHALGTFYGREFIRVNNDGRQLFRCERADADCVNGETLSPTAADFRVIGNANPDFAIGLRSHIDAGRFDVSFLVRGEVGRDVFNNTALVYGKATTGGRNFLRSGRDMDDAIGEPAIFSSRWVEDGSFVRLQNLTVGYTFNMPRVGGGGQAARVYVSGDNLFLITGYDGYDPEVHTDAGLGTRGIDYLNYPRPRTITTGIRFTF